MTTITSSLERSLQNCSLNQGVSRRNQVSRMSSSSSPSSSTTYDHHHGVTESSASSSDDPSISLNSTALPYHWEQFLDLKTGELYYINWRTGAKVNEDPRAIATGYNGDSEDGDEDNDDKEEDEESSSSTESSTCSSTRQSFTSMKRGTPNQDSVLVVAGCTRCLMYYMVARHVVECPKCCGQLLQFSAN